MTKASKLTVAPEAILPIEQQSHIALFDLDEPLTFLLNPVFTLIG